MYILWLLLSLVRQVLLRSKVDSTIMISIDCHGDVSRKSSISRWHAMFTLLGPSAVELNEHKEPQRDDLYVASLSLVHRISFSSKADGTSTISTDVHGNTSCKSSFSRWHDAFTVLILSASDRNEHEEPRRDDFSSLSSGLVVERNPTRLRRFPSPELHPQTR
jgi:hypothetical protein